MIVYMMVEYVYLMYLLYRWLPLRRQEGLKYVLLVLVVVSLFLSVYSMFDLTVLAQVNGARYFQLLIIAGYLLYWYLGHGPNEGMINPVTVILSAVLLYSSVGSFITIFLFLFNMKLPYYLLMFTSNLLYCAFVYTLVKFIKTHKLKEKYLAEHNAG